MTHPPRVSLSTSGGNSVVVAEPMVVGRSPERDGFVPLALHDPQFSVSRNHVTVAPVSALVVRMTDLGSTNGSAVRVGSSEIQLRPNEPTHVTLPCRLLVGDHWVDVRAG